MSGGEGVPDVEELEFAGWLYRQVDGVWMHDGGGTLASPKVEPNPREQAMLDALVALRSERDQLARWRAEGMEVLDAWDRVYEAAGKPGLLGQSMAAATENEVRRLSAERDRAVEALYGWRGRVDHPHGRHVVHSPEVADVVLALTDQVLAALSSEVQP